MDDYIKIYEECKNRTYHNTKLEPLINYLYDIVNKQDKNIKQACNYSNKEESKKYYNNSKMSFIKELLEIFNKMIDYDNYNDLDEVLKLFNNSKLEWTQLYEYLSTIYNKDEYYRTDNFYYNFMIVELSRQMRIGDIKGEYNFPLFKMISVYKKYNDIIDNNPNRPAGIIRFFDRITPRIISYFHLDDYSVEDLDSLLNDIVNNYQDYNSYFELNGVYEVERFVMIQPREIQLVETIISNKISDKKIIK